MEKRQAKFQLIFLLSFLFFFLARMYLKILLFHPVRCFPCYCPELFSQILMNNEVCCSIQMPTNSCEETCHLPGSISIFLVFPGICRRTQRSVHRICSFSAKNGTLRIRKYSVVLPVKPQLLVQFSLLPSFSLFHSVFE